MAMYAMQQHQQYAYAAAPAPRQFSGHGTSSAFSSSANPDEDWTKISDLAERRRIQNRIAQRNYRKKLKRRLEDLERRAGTSDGASSSGAEKTSSSSRSSKKSSTPKKPQPSPVVVAQPPKPMTHPSQFTPPMHPEDDLLFQTGYDDRDRSQSPPMFAYSAYPPPEDMMMAPYSSAQPYRAMAAVAYPDWTTASVPATLPPMSHFSDAVKRDPYAAEDAMGSYMSYGFMDVHAANPYDHHSNPNTPPLSHSFDHSTNCSDSGYDYPTTPLSMPGSPNLIQH